eukprot:2247211-Rhodomonas_salina.1
MHFHARFFFFSSEVSRISNPKVLRRPQSSMALPLRPPPQSLNNPAFSASGLGTGESRSQRPVTASAAACERASVSLFSSPTSIELSPTSLLSGVEFPVWSSRAVPGAAAVRPPRRPHQEVKLRGVGLRHLLTPCVPDPLFDRALVPTALMCYLVSGVLVAKDMLSVCPDNAAMFAIDLRLGVAAARSFTPEDAYSLAQASFQVPGSISGPEAPEERDSDSENVILKVTNLRQERAEELRAEVQHRKREWKVKREWIRSTLDPRPWTLDPRP